MTIDRMPQASRIEEAATLIDPIFLNTPLVRSEALDRALGQEVALKVETLTPIRSFKKRGASYLMHRLDGAADGGVVCASAGNFGQGIAHAGRGFGVPVTVFSYQGANPLKLEAMQRFGAEIHLEGHDFDAAKSAARAFAAATGAPAMYLSWRDGRVIETASVDTIADGIAVRVPVPEALEAMRTTVDDVVLVEDTAMIAAVRLAFETVGLLVEPTGAVGLAALLADPNLGRGQRVSTILCGGNVALPQARAWLLELP